MKRKTRRSTPFVVCVDNAGYPASLEVGKLYKVVPDADAAAHGYVRVIDESGEDYGYSAKRFFVLGVPDALAKALRTRRTATVVHPHRVSQPTAAPRRRVKA